MKTYRWKSKPDQYEELGLIAQDVLDLGYIDLIEMTPNDDENLKFSSDPTLEPIGVKLSMNYPRLASYNMRMIQHLMAEIEALKALVSEIHQANEIRDSPFLTAQQ